MTTSREVSDLLAAVAREPTNLALRVKAGNALIQTGALDQALEMFRSVVRGHAQSGRHAQARIVAKSVLQHAPDDPQLLSAIAGPSSTTIPPPFSGRTVDRYDGDRTPLPTPMPYHDADPSRISISFDLVNAAREAPESTSSVEIDVDFDVEEPSLVGTDPLLRPGVVAHSGLSAAARLISQRLQNESRDSDTQVEAGPKTDRPSGRWGPDPASKPTLVRSNLRASTPSDELATQRVPLQDLDDDGDVTHLQPLLTPPPGE